MDALLQLGLGGGALGVLVWTIRSLVGPIIQSHVDTLAKIGATMAEAATTLAANTRALGEISDANRAAADAHADMARVLHSLAGRIGNEP